jgi:hypothetical protein
MDGLGWDQRDPAYQSAVEACCGAQRLVALIGNVTPIGPPAKPGRHRPAPPPPTPPGERPGWMNSYGPG